MTLFWERRGRAALRAGVCFGLCLSVSACASVEMGSLERAVGDVFGSDQRAGAPDGAPIIDAAFPPENSTEAYAPGWSSGYDDLAAGEDPVAPAEDDESGSGLDAVFSLLAGVVGGDEDEEAAETAETSAVVAPVETVAVDRPVTRRSARPQSSSRVDASRAQAPRLASAEPQVETNVQAASAADLTRNRVRARNLSNKRLHDEAADAWRSVVDAGGGESDHLNLISSLVRSEQWDAAAEELDRFPGALANERGLMLSAIVYDQKERWTEADAAYGDALAVSKTPHLVLNNWGVSAMSRGEHKAAADFFVRALRHNPDFANAKANLALARGLDGEYELPQVDFTEAEKATVLHDLGLIAYRRGDLDEAETRFRAALETHPRYYRKAADMLLRIQKVRGGVRDL